MLPYENLVDDVLDGEVWVPIKYWEDLYHVSNLGRVKSVTKEIQHTRWKHCKRLRRGKILKQVNSDGYRYVNFSRCGKVITVHVHRIVAQMFIPNPENKFCVNHKNGIRNDNRAENLEWATKQEDVLHAYNILKRSRFSKTVCQKTLSGQLLNVFKSSKEASNNTGVPIRSIRDCACGKYKTGSGYLWSYL